MATWTAIVVFPIPNWLPDPGDVITIAGTVVPVGLGVVETVVVGEVVVVVGGADVVVVVVEVAGLDEQAASTNRVTTDIRTINHRFGFNLIFNSHS
ncbi:MAG TPA: hypothetical protein VF318_05590 [Dehalococcoidales bacterium]